MKLKTLTLFTLLLTSPSGYSLLSPMESVINNPSRAKNSFFFQNKTQTAILYTARVIERSSNEKGKLSVKSKADFSIPKDYISISPKKFVLKSNQGQKINYSIDKDKIKKLNKAMYLIGFNVHIEKIVKLKEDKLKDEKIISSKVSLLPEITTSIVYLNPNKKNIFNQVSLSKYSYKNNILTVEMKKHPEIFGLGALTIFHSTDKKKWTKVYRAEERFFIDSVTRSVSIPKEIKSGFLKIKYIPISRYKFEFKEYFSKEIKI